jgi:hypothetical protein
MPCCVAAYPHDVEFEEEARMTWWRGLGLVLAGVGLIAGTASADVVAPGRPAPELATGAWINSEPLSMQRLRGRVVLVDFWTYG